MIRRLLSTVAAVRGQPFGLLGEPPAPAQATRTVEGQEYLQHALEIRERYILQSARTEVNKRAELLPLFATRKFKLESVQ